MKTFECLGKIMSHQKQHFVCAAFIYLPFFITFALILLHGLVRKLNIQSEFSLSQTVRDGLTPIQLDESGKLPPTWTRRVEHTKLARRMLTDGPTLWVRFPGITHTDKMYSLKALDKIVC